MISLAGLQPPNQLKEWQLPPLMEKYVPEMPLVEGLFGGLYWGKGYRNSYEWLGACLFLIPRLLRRINDLEIALAEALRGRE